MVSDKMIKGPYDPVVARQKNSRLQEAYKSHQEDTLTYETHLVSQIVNGSLAGVGNEQVPENLAVAMGTSLNGIMQRCIDSAERKGESIVGERSTIADSQELSIKDKKAKLERKKQVINETSQVLANQQRTIENAKNSIVNATNIGCESKDEYSTIIKQMTQQKSTKSELQKMRIEQNLSSFQSSKNEQKNNSQSIDKPKVMKKTNNNPKNNTSSSGFVNIITLSLIVSFICGALLMIVYMLINK